MLLALIFAVASAMADGPSSPVSSCAAQIGTCEYYTCQEDQWKCGAEGYYLQFGYRYCRDYAAAASTFSSFAQAWLAKVRTCLQTELEAHLDQASCETVRTFAIHSHVACYVDHGFCQLGTFEKLHVFWIARAEVQRPEIQETFHQLDLACSEPL